MSDDGRPAGDDTLGGLVGYHLRRAQLRAFAAFAAAVRDDALTPMLFGVMAVIRDRGDLHQSDIAAALGADRSTMVRLVDQLQKRGLAVRVTSSSDRRVSVPRLTEPSGWNVTGPRLETRISGAAIGRSFGLWRLSPLR